MVCGIHIPYRKSRLWTRAGIRLSSGSSAMMAYRMEADQSTVFSVERLAIHDSITPCSICERIRQIMIICHIEPTRWAYAKSRSCH
ncbi:hypothetical protein AMS68_002262 [Peltaster fructicola]|uniref:Uncharacterized protein n=1 Tax=Peltaster fructicola TaxID=286661 RepID=A0A6H0XQ33_9PEZI|nr:hypothetical protein AMS68_002262 [Peltaster fructicola]